MKLFQLSRLLTKSKSFADINTQPINSLKKKKQLVLAMNQNQFDYPFSEMAKIKINTVCYTTDLFSKDLKI